jgi:hypothetical protein
MAKKKKETKGEYVQLDLIPPTEVEKLYKEFNEVKDSSDKVRRGIFSKHTELSKKIEELTCQIESLKHQLVVVTEWTITQIGGVSNVQNKQDGSLQETISLHVTPINAAYADKTSRLHMQETLDILSLTG